MKKLRVFLCLLLCAALLTGCTPELQAPPDVTLPPAAPGPEPPIGDAGLQYEAIVPLYLPSLDGQSLLAFYETLTLPRDQHPAESILRALLAHPGNSRVQPLGGGVPLTLSGADPVEISCGVCTVNLSASALQLSGEELYTVALAIAATLCETGGVSCMNLLVAGTPVAMDVGGNLPLGTLTSQTGQELPVLWEQLSARRTPVGQLASATPLTAAATLYFPLADGSGVVAEPRRIAFPGQHPQQQVIALLAALSNGAEQLVGIADMPDLASLQLFAPEVTDLASGGRRVTLHFTSDVVNRLSAAGCDPACVFAAITMTLTTFVPSLQQLLVLTGNGALTSLYNGVHGSLLLPGALITRQDFAPYLMSQATIFRPEDKGLTALVAALPYRQSASPRALLLYMASPAVGALPEGLTDADLLGLSVQDGTLLIHFSARYGEVIRQSGMDQRLMAYSMVNTLCNLLEVRQMRFHFGSDAPANLGGSVVWNGTFMHNPGLINP